MYDREEVLDALATIAEVGVPTTAAARILDVGSGDYLEYFQKEIIEEMLATGGATCCFFEGTYGAGKTHLLQLFQHMASQKNMLVAEVELANDMNFSNWQSVTKRILEKIRYRTPSGDIQSLPRILDYLARNDLARVPSLRIHSLPHVGFVNAIEIYLQHNQTLEVAKKEKLTRYLLGEKITAGDLRRSGINGVKNPLSKRNAELVFRTVLSALHHLNFPGTMLLFDEIDQTFQNVLRSSNRALIAANLLRRLIDACSLSDLRGVCLIFGVSQNFIPRCSEVYPALHERLVIFRNNQKKIGWRSPVIRLDVINAYKEHQLFVNAAIEKFTQLAKIIGAQDRIRQHLEKCSQEVMASHAGLDFRRPLMRRFASTLLQRS